MDGFPHTVNFDDGDLNPQDAAGGYRFAGISLRPRLKVSIAGEIVRPKGAS